MLTHANKLPKTPGVLVVKPTVNPEEFPSSPVEVMASCPWRVNSRIPRGTKNRAANGAGRGLLRFIYLVGGLEHGFYFSIYWE
jgi:hypothetical protein